MKSFAAVSGLALLCLAVNGCLIIADCEPCKSKPDCRPPAFVVRHEPLTAEIDAACSLISETGKFQLFAAIASRPNLSDSAQVYLVRKTADCFVSESNKLDILLALMSNSAFSPAGKNEILAKLNMFISESNKQTILDEFNKLALKAAQTPPPAATPPASPDPQPQK
jgi:hypothetical protein